MTITAEEALAREEEVLERHPVVLPVLEEAIAAGRREIDGVIARFHGGAVADGHQEEALRAVRERTLRRYATRVAAEFTSEEISTWRALVGQVRDALAAAAAPTGVPGALRLSYAVDDAPEDVPLAGSLDDLLADARDVCVCGYAQTRQPPKRLCAACSDVILHVWTLEERRLLSTVPAWMAEVDERLDEALDELASLSLRPEEGLSDDLRTVRHRAGRSLGRISKAHRSEAAGLDLATWTGFAELMMRSSYTEPHGDARRHGRWGLGTAQLATLGLAGSPEVVARMKTIVRRGETVKRRSWWAR